MDIQKTQETAMSLYALSAFKNAPCRKVTDSEVVQDNWSAHFLALQVSALLQFCTDNNRFMLSPGIKCEIHLQLHKIPEVGLFLF